jgi:hypothetical protein
MDFYLTNTEICEIIKRIVNILNSTINSESVSEPESIARYTVRGPDFQWFNNHGILDKGIEIFINNNINTNFSYNIDIINFNMFSWYSLYDFIPYIVDIYYECKDEIGYNETNTIIYNNGYPDLKYASENNYLDYYIIMFIKTL